MTVCIFENWRCAIFRQHTVKFSPLRRSSVDLEESHELPHKYRKKMFLVQDSYIDDHPSDVNAEDEKTHVICRAYLKGENSPLPR